MNGPGDIPLTTLSSTPDTRPCSLISIIPTLGMSSCRGRAEAFARRLSSKLRTLGSQTDDDANSPEDEPIINGGGSANTWMSGHDTEHTVTDLQPLRHESDSFFDFDCELESPGSPVDECEYLRLIETASNTPHNSAAESGYVCASAASSHSSTDYYDVGNGSSEGSAGGATNEASSSSSGGLKEQHGEQQQTEQTAEQQSSNLHHQTEQEQSSNQQQSTEQQQSTDLHQRTDACNTTTDTTSPTSSTSSTIVAATGTATTTPPPSPQTSAILPVMPAYINAMPDTDNDPQPKSLPTTGPDDADTTDFAPVELSAEENARMQGDIISELQKQSDQYGQDHTEIRHTITNGHAADGDEVLKIEVSEVAAATTTSGVTEAATEAVTEATREATTEAATEAATEETIEATATATSATEAATSATEATPSTTKVASTTQTTPTEALPQTAPESIAEPTVKESSTLHDTTDDEDDCRPQRVRRCSSLKTGKTPPGTPGRKKIVRFADVLGLDLADVKTFLDEIPTIPKSAFEDLEILDAEPPLQLGPKSDKLLMPLFQQPGGLPTFLDLVREKQVSLENAAVTDSINQTITGSVRVRNLDFNKSVHIRYTLDGWRSFADLQANYVANSCDGFSDKFSFVLFGNTLQIGQRLEFAVRFQCKGQQFWDSNYGANYCFQCLPTSTPAQTSIAPIVPSHHQASFAGMLSPTAGDAWCSSFY